MDTEPDIRNVIKIHAFAPKSRTLTLTHTRNCFLIEVLVTAQNKTVFSYNKSNFAQRLWQQF